MDEVIRFQNHCRKLKGVLFSLRDRKSSTTLLTPVVQDYSKLVKVIESLLEVQSDTQRQTQQLLKTSTAQPPSDSRLSHERGHIHLPKLSLPTFDGNVLKFTEFIDIFSSTSIYKNSQLSNVKELSYLNNCLMAKPKMPFPVIS